MSNYSDATIMAVDDNSYNLRLLSDVLTQAGYIVRGAIDSETALLAIAENPPDLILLDINMPKMDGYALAQKLQDNPETKHIPIIFMSALNDSESILKAFDSGGVDYVSKPFKYKEVLARVRTHLTINYQRRELARLHERDQELLKKVSQSEALYRDLFDNASDLIQSIDGQGNFLYANRHWHHVLGYTSDEIKHINLGDIIHPDHLETCLNTFEEIKQKPGVIQNIETVFVTKNGEEIIVEGNINCDFDDDNNLHTRGIFRDITFKKRAEKDLLAQQERLEALHRIETFNMTDVQERLGYALHIGCHILGMDGGFVSQIKGETCKIIYQYFDQNQFSTDAIKTLTRSFFNCANPQYTAFAINTPDEDEAFNTHLWHQELGLKSLISDTIIINDADFGTLSFVSKQEKRPKFNENDHNFVSLITQWISSVLEHDTVLVDLRSSEERFRIMFEAAPIGIFLMTLDGKLERVNSAFSDLLGYSKDELYRTNINELANSVIYFGQSLSADDDNYVYYIEQDFNHKDGKTVYTLLKATWLRTSENDPLTLMGQVIDITDRRYAEQELSSRNDQLELLRQLDSELIQTLDIDSVLRLAIDIAGRYTNASILYIALATDNGLEIIRYLGDYDQNLEGYLLPNNTLSSYVFNHLEAKMLQNTSPSSDQLALRTDTVSLMSFPLASSGRKIGILGLETNELDNFTESAFDFLTLFSQHVASALDNSWLFDQVQEQLESLQALHAQVSHQAMHDSLTQLPNRDLFSERLDDAIDKARDDNRLMALLCIDLDGFKSVNDSLGHAAGDQLLQKVSERLVDSVRKQDTVARMGGDEFTIILPDISHTRAVSEIASRVLASLNAPFTIEGERSKISASIGVSLYPKDGQDPVSLLKKADTALYLSKEAGKNTINFYDTHLSPSYTEDALLGNLIRQAIDKDQLVLFYQPQVDTKTGKVIGFEALLRWKLSTQQIIFPNKIFPIAKKFGMLFPINDWVFRNACKQQQEWWERGLHYKMSINVAIPQFEQAQFVDFVASTLKKYDFPASSIELEFTEHLMLSNLEESVEKVRALRAMGVKIALDDFGSGYSSLSYLQRLPIDTIKLDGQLINGLEADSDTARKSKAIVKSIITLSKELDLVVIAEGVESEYQLDFLRSIDTNVIQGYFFSKPVPANEAIAQVQYTP